MSITPWSLLHTDVYADATAGRRYALTRSQKSSCNKMPVRIRKGVPPRYFAVPHTLALRTQSKVGGADRESYSTFGSCGHVSMPRQGSGNYLDVGKRRLSVQIRINKREEREEKKMI